MPIEKKFNRREFLKFGAVSLGLGFLNFSLSKCGLPRLALVDSSIGLKNPKSFEKSSNLLEYLYNPDSSEKSTFEFYVTKDRKALVFDRTDDSYILKPFEEELSDSGENKLEIISGAGNILNPGLDKKIKDSYLADISNVKAITSLVYCLDNKGLKEDVIGYALLHPDKKIEVEEISSRRVHRNRVIYNFNFRIRDRDFFYDQISAGGGAAGGAGSGGASGGAGGSGGDGAGSGGSGGASGGAGGAR